MVNFDISKEWGILFPFELIAAEKSAEDLSRCLFLLGAKQPVICDSEKGTQAEAVIVLNSEGFGPERNGFDWRAAGDRVEIYGESVRGLCNGIYSFLAALGIAWPSPGQATLPSPAAAKNPNLFPLTMDSACEPSHYEGENPAEAPWRRFVPAGMRTVKAILRKSEQFTAWAAQQRYDAIVLPLAAFAGMERKVNELKKNASAYDISLEAGGRDLSALAPRKFFLLHQDFFRMAEGKRKRDHHFCPTNPGAIRLIEQEAARLFQAAADTKVFHLWPDTESESAWCSCPSCRAFTFQEQNRISVNIAADVLSRHESGAWITYYEKQGTGGSIPLRKNLVRMEKLPEEKDFR